MVTHPLVRSRGVQDRYRKSSIMPFIPIPRGISICFPVTIASQKLEFCITVQKASGVVVPSTDFDTIEAAIEAAWGSTLKPLQSTQATMTGPILTDQSAEGGAQQIYPFSQTGTASGAAVPNNAALVVSHRTAKRGRSYRGRSYFTGIPVSAQNTPVAVTSTYASDLADAFITLVDAIGAVGFPQIVASKQHNGAVTSPAATNLVTATIVDTNFDSQRRRLFGRGS